MKSKDTLRLFKKITTNMPKNYLNSNGIFNFQKMISTSHIEKTKFQKNMGFKKTHYFDSHKEDKSKYLITFLLNISLASAILFTLYVLSVKALLAEEETDIDELDELVEAVRRGDLKKLKRKQKDLSSGLYQKILNNFGLSLLHITLVFDVPNKQEIIEWLLDNKIAEVDEVTSYSSNKQQRLHQTRLGMGGDDYSPFSGEETALFYVLRERDEKLLNYFIQKGASVTRKNARGKTVLHVCRTKEQMSLLMKAGAYIYINEGDNEGNTPLNDAVFEGHEEEVEYLLENGASVTKKNKWGQTVIHSAVYSGNKKILETLIKKGAPFAAKDEEGRSPLFTAIMAGSKAKEMMEFLVELGLSLNEKDDEGNTLLHHAVVCGRKEVVEFLLSHGLDPLEKNDDGETALTLVSGSWHSEEIEEKKNMMLGIQDKKPLKKEDDKKIIENKIENIKNIEIQLVKKIDEDLTKEKEYLERIKEYQEKQVVNKIKSEKKREQDIESTVENFKRILREKLNVTVYADKAVQEGMVRPNASGFDQMLEIAQLVSTVSGDLNLRIAAALGKIILQGKFEEYKREKTAYIKKFKNVYIGEALDEVAGMIAERYKFQLLEMTGGGMDSFASYFHDKVINYLHHPSYFKSQCETLYNDPNAHSIFIKYPLWLSCSIFGPDRKTKHIVREMFEAMIDPYQGPSISLELRGKKNKEKNTNPEQNWDSHELVKNIGILIEDDETKSGAMINPSQHLYYVYKDPNENKKEYGYCLGDKVFDKRFSQKNPSHYKIEDHIKFWFKKYKLSEKNLILDNSGTTLTLNFYCDKEENNFKKLLTELENKNKEIGYFTCDSSINEKDDKKLASIKISCKVDENNKEKRNKTLIGINTLFEEYLLEKKAEEDDLLQNDESFNAFKCKP